MDLLRIDDQATLDAAVSRPSFLLFKQSFRCPISARAFGRYRSFVEANPTVPTGWIDVVEARPLARGIADATRVAHESPQALWFRDGRVVWHASHEAITEASLSKATGAGSGVEPRSAPRPAT